MFSVFLIAAMRCIPCYDGGSMKWKLTSKTAGERSDRGVRRSEEVKKGRNFEVKSDFLESFMIFLYNSTFHVHEDDDVSSLLNVSSFDGKIIIDEKSQKYNIINF